MLSVEVLMMNFYAKFAIMFMNVVHFIAAIFALGVVLREDTMEVLVVQDKHKV